MAEDEHLDRFAGDVGLQVVTPPCATCKHRSQKAPGFCLAFPKGIPAEILQGKNDHKEPFKGDHGIQYEPIEK